ncbi:DUF7528 family protein [Halovivax cerinus]
MEKFSGDGTAVRTVCRQSEADGRRDVVRVRVDGHELRLTESAARDLRRALDEALATERVLGRTIGTRRPDGRYVVERRGVTSTGNRKVFDSFDELRDRYESLPATFTAADLERPGLTGSRRHAVLWHLVEHPAFDCDLERKQPLTAKKRTG